MNGNVKWFAIGAVTCAGCFMLGGMGKQPVTEVLKVDQLLVSDTLLVGKQGGFAWSMSSNAAGAELACYDGMGNELLKTLILPQGSMSFWVTGSGADRKLIRLGVTEGTVVEEGVQLFMINGDKELSMSHQGGNEVVWTASTKSP